MTLEKLAAKALDGDRAAVEAVVRGIQGDVHALAVRMLWDPADADDATQEILVRVVTRLAKFDRRSGFRTWVYRVATNYLIDVKRSPVERLQLTFEAFSEDLHTGLSDAGHSEVEQTLLIEEVRIGCTLAMLQCLDRLHRAAYVLGEILELSSADAAAAADTSPATFRKRLQRARTRVDRFTRRHCGLIGDEAACRCHRRVARAVATGRVRETELAHASVARSFVEARNLIRAADVARRGLALHQTANPRRSPVDFARRIADSLDSAGSLA